MIVAQSVGGGSENLARVAILIGVEESKEDREIACGQQTVGV